MIYVQLPKGYKAQCISFLQIAHIVSSYTQVNVEAMRGTSRQRPIAYARHAFCYLALKNCTTSLAELGRYLGRRDHTTVLHSRDTVADMLFKRHDFAKEVDAMQQIIDKRSINPAYLRRLNKAA